MVRVEPDDEMAAGTELLDNEASLGEYTMVDKMFGCWQKGGNTLTLTDKRVVIKNWDNALGGFIESSVREESFDYEDVVHVKAAAGRPLFMLMVGGLLEVLGLIVVIAAFINASKKMGDCPDGGYNSYGQWQQNLSPPGCEEDAKEERTKIGLLGGLMMVLGVLFLMYFFAGKGLAYVTLDMTKDKEVGSFSTGLVSWDTLKNPFSAIFGAGKPRRHATCVLKLSKKDAFAATSKICAVRQGLKEKLSRVL